MHLLDTAPFEETFGKKKLRKRPTMGVSDMSTLAASVSERESEYDPSNDRGLVFAGTGKKERHGVATEDGIMNEVCTLRKGQRCFICVHVNGRRWFTSSHGSMHSVVINMLAWYKPDRVD